VQAAWARCNRARDTRLGRDVAIKVLPEGLANDADRLRRFEQEARTIAALNHPNILGIHDIGAHDGAPFLSANFLKAKRCGRSRSGAAAGAARHRVCAWHRAGTRGGTREGIRAPGPETGERICHSRRKGLKFWISGWRSCEAGGSHRNCSDAKSSDFAGHGDGYRRLHVARAGAGRT